VPPFTVLRRVAEMARTGAIDPRLGNRLSMLLLQREIDEKQATAGFKYAELHGSHDRLLGLPRRSPASTSFEQGWGGLSLTEAEDEAAVEALYRAGGDRALPAQAIDADERLRRVWRVRRRFCEARAGFAPWQPARPSRRPWTASVWTTCICRSASWFSRRIA
jgi:hypothetical protein